MVDSFVRMLDAQERLQERHEDGDPWTMVEREHKIAFMRQQYVNMTVETVEALNEIGWKPWGSSRHINAEAGMKELIDHFHFLMNWMMCLAPEMGLKNNAELVEWFTEAYFDKNLVNHQRRDANYDGFAEKCPQCGREKEAAVWEEGDLETPALTCNCGHVFDVKEPNYDDV
jgi:dimeric dUTPase (all-alpha-NTP-PPase superfamily)